MNDSSEFVGPQLAQITEARGAFPHDAHVSMLFVRSFPLNADEQLDERGECAHVTATLNSSMQAQCLESRRPWPKPWLFVGSIQPPARNVCCYLCSAALSRSIVYAALRARCLP